MSLAVRIKNFFLGGAVLTVSPTMSELILDICMKNHIPYKIKEFDEEKMIFSLSLHYGKRLADELGNRGCEYSFLEKGLPSFLKKYKRRPGLLIGAFLILFLVILSSSVVWDIRVSGNSSLSTAEIIDGLRLENFGIGSVISERDVDEITNKVILSNPRIAWMSINLRGTVAYVEVREHIERVLIEDTSTPSNLVASRDGMIEYAEVIRGSLTVKQGDAVREGEVLISGVTENKNGNYRLEHAQGKVFATTNHTFTVKIPLVYTENVLTDSVCTSKTVNFFGKNINIFRKSGNLGATCVKIEEEKDISLFGLPPLPISISSESIREYRTEEKKRSPEAASELAFFELNNLIYTTLSSADILSKTIKTELTDEFFIIKCDLICSENIAVGKPISKND